MHLKKLRRAEGGAKTFLVFRVKNHDFTPKNHIFSNFRGARAGCTPPGSAPGVEEFKSHFSIYVQILLIIVNIRGRRGRMVVGFITTYAINAYLH